MSKWHKRFFDLSEMVASWSKDPSTKVGAVIVDEDTHQILSVGYNGFPKGIADTVERLENREEKYKYVVHAEINSIFNAAKTGANISGKSIYVWAMPVCSKCASAIVSTGIKKVYVKQEFLNNARWEAEWCLSVDIFNEAKVELIVL